MNGRDYKPNFEGGYFHSYNRGVNKSLIFLDEQDYENFIYRAKILLSLVPLPKRKKNGKCIRLKPLLLNSLEILCYCLMPNHFHFLFKQNKVGAQKIFFRRLCTSYSIYFNKKYKRVGHVFQDIYKTKNVLDDNYLTQLTGYIHLNPSDPFSWKYSSLSEYLGQKGNGLCQPGFFMKAHKITSKSYLKFLKNKYTDQHLKSADLIFDDEDQN